ncbi:MAG: helix-turn-helix domain-containing protein [bacterium]
MASYYSKEETANILQIKLGEVEECLPKKKYYNAVEVAKMFNVSKPYLTKILQKGYFGNAFKIGRKWHITISQIKEYAKKRSEKNA